MRLCGCVGCSLIDNRVDSDDPQRAETRESAIHARVSGPELFEVVGEAEGERHQGEGGVGRATRRVDRAAGHVQVGQAVYGQLRSDYAGGGIGAHAKSAHGVVRIGCGEGAGVAGECPGEPIEMGEAGAVKLLTNDGSISQSGCDGLLRRWPTVGHLCPVALRIRSAGALGRARRGSPRPLVAKAPAYPVPAGGGLSGRAANSLRA